MGRREIAEIDLLYRKWMDRLYDPGFRTSSFTEQSKEIGVSGPTISKWRREMSNEKWANILKISRQNVALPSFEIDGALYKAAMGGDVQAMKLWKEAMEGWSSKQNIELTRGKDQELTSEGLFADIRDILKTLNPEQKAMLAQDLASPVDPSPSEVIEAVVERPEPIPEGGQ